MPSKDEIAPEIVIHLLVKPDKVKNKKIRLVTDQRPNMSISRLSHDLRHPKKAFHAFEGFPRCKKLDNKPIKHKAMPVSKVYWLI